MISFSVLIAKVMLRKFWLLMKFNLETSKEDVATERPDGKVRDIHPDSSRIKNGMKASMIILISLVFTILITKATY
jgi:Ca2+/H+ antiporter